MNLEDLGNASVLSIRHKVVFVGNPFAGKTSIMNKLVNNEFKDTYDQTIGVDFYTKTMMFRENIFKLQLWDSAGQEKYKSLIPSYVRGASLIFTIYDITSEESFNAVTNWISFIKQNLEVGDTKLILVANKIDLERKIKTQRGQSLAKKEGMSFYEVSAKTSENLVNMFFSSFVELSFFDEYREEGNNNNNAIVNELIDQNAKDPGVSKSSIVDQTDNQSKIQIKGSPNTNLGNQQKSKDDKKCNC